MTATAAIVAASTKSTTPPTTTMTTTVMTTTVTTSIINGACTGRGGEFMKENNDGSRLRRQRAATRPQRNQKIATPHWPWRVQLFYGRLAVDARKRVLKINESRCRRRATNVAWRIRTRRNERKDEMIMKMHLSSANYISINGETEFANFNKICKNFRLDYVW